MVLGSQIEQLDLKWNCMVVSGTEDRRSFVRRIMLKEIENGVIVTREAIDAAMRRYDKATRSHRG